MDAQFAHAATNAFRVSEVALRYRLQSRQNASLGLFVLEVGKPLCQDVGLLDLERCGIVSVRIHPVKEPFPGFGGLTPELSGSTPPLRGEHFIVHCRSNEMLGRTCDSSKLSLQATERL